MNPAAPRAGKAAEIFFLTAACASLFFTSYRVFYGDFTAKEIFVYFSGAAAMAALFALREIRVSLYPLLVLAFALVCAASGAGNQESASYLKTSRALYWMALGVAAIFLHSAAQGARKKLFGRAMRAANAIIVLTAGAQAALFLIRPGQPSDVFGGRIYLPAGNPDLLALAVIMTFPPVLAKALGKKKVFIALAALNAAAIVMTGSASGMIVFSCQLLYLLASWQGFKKAAAGMLVIGALAAAAWAATGRPGVFLGEKWESLQLRRLLADSALRMAADFPLLGAGAGGFRIMSPKYQSIAASRGGYPGFASAHDEAYVHNDILQAASETGVIGAAVFLALLLFPVIAGRKDPVLSAFFGGVVLFSLFNFPFSYPYSSALFVLSASLFVRGKEFRFSLRSAGQRLAAGAAAGAVAAAVFVPLIGSHFGTAFLTQRAAAALKAGGDAPAAVAAAAGRYERYILADYQLSFYMGTILRAAGESAAGKKYLENAVRIFPYFEGALFNLGNAYFSAGQNEEALDAYGRAIRIGGRNAAALNNAGRCAIEAGKTGDAIDYLKRAVEISPGLTEANFNLAYAYYLDNNIEKAGEYTEKALAAGPGYAPALELKKKLGRTGK